MAPVTRLLARDHASGTPQQQDDSLIHGTAKSAKIRKRPKLEKPDKQNTAPGLEHLQALEAVNQKGTPDSEHSRQSGHCTACLAAVIQGHRDDRSDSVSPTRASEPG